jgi:hypothetical protein
MFGILIYLLLVLLISDQICLDAAIYGNLQVLEEQNFDQQQRARGKCSLTKLILYCFSL